MNKDDFIPVFHFPGQPKICPRGDGEPDCENCPDFDGENCTYPTN